MTDYTNYEVEDFLQDDFFIDWVLKGTAEHELFWREWLTVNPSKRADVEKARLVVSSINVKPLDVSLTDADVDEMVNNIKNQLLHNSEKETVITAKFGYLKYLKVAAVLLAFSSIAFLFIKKRQVVLPASTYVVHQPGSEYLNVTNTSGSSKLIRMSDGSLAVLKPGSGLKYLRSFAKKREVFLNGEAFFEVHKNPAIPFRVHSGDMVVRVLGTSFTVKSSQNKQDFKVVVNTGKVLVYKGEENIAKPNTKNSVTLTPNQQVIYKAKELIFKKETLQVPLILSKEIAQREFTFDNAAFSAIVEKIGRVYEVNIEFDKTQFEGISLSASLSDRPLDEKVKLICKAVNASCEFTDGRIIIHGRQK